MSDDILSIIPSDPEYVPVVAAQQMALALFSSFVGKADEVNMSVTDEVQFVDAGENFESVTCPACGADLNGWWQGAVETAFANQFADLTVQVPCCGAQGSLNDLVYNWPAGFARFRLTARNPVKDVDDGQVAMLSSILKSDVRKVWSRY